MNYQPINDCVLIETVEAKKSLIELPESAKEDKPDQGKVVASDSDKVKKGDTVIFKRYSPDEVILGGTKYLLVDVKDIKLKIS